MTPIEQASSILNKNLLKNVKSKFITCGCLNGRRFSTKLFSVAHYEQVKSKFSSIFQWYEDFSGFTEVKAAQQKVTIAGEKLEILQEERRQAWANLVEIQKKLKENYAQLENTKKGDERYIHLIKLEFNILKEEKTLEEKYRDTDQAERAQFLIFTNAVKNSHEVEKIQSEKKKYYSVIASVIGALIGIVGTSINHYFKMSELRLLISKSSVEYISDQLDDHFEKIENLVQAFSRFEKNYDVINLNNFYLKLDNRLISMENCIKAIQNRNNANEVLKNDQSKSHNLNSNSFGKFTSDEIKKVVNAIPTGLMCFIGLIILSRMFS